MRQFFEVRQVPIHCNVLLHSREEATQYPKGDMVLGFCNVCGLIYNLAFDPELMNYTLQWMGTCRTSKNWCPPSTLSAVG